MSRFATYKLLEAEFNEYVERIAHNSAESGAPLTEHDAKHLVAIAAKYMELQGADDYLLADVTDTIIHRWNTNPPAPGAIDQFCRSAADSVIYFSDWYNDVRE